MSKILKFDEKYTLFDDDSVRKKITILSKWDAMLDDQRNPCSNFEQELEKFLTLGKSYQIEIIVKEL
jgi:hypothetical protein